MVFPKDALLVDTYMSWVSLWVFLPQVLCFKTKKVIYLYQLSFLGSVFWDENKLAYWEEALWEGGGRDSEEMKGALAPLTLWGIMGYLAPLTLWDIMLWRPHHIRATLGIWGDGSVCNLLVTQAWGPQFDPHNPCEKARQNPNTGNVAPWAW